MYCNIEKKNFDLIILGAGSGGYATALRASQLGMSIALIEKNKVGGTCLHYGCIPTKTFLHASHIYNSITDAKTFGINLKLQKMDFAKFKQYKLSIINRLHKGLNKLLNSKNIHIIEGEGRFYSKNEVQISNQTIIKGKNIVIASGTYPKELNFCKFGINDRILSSQDALNLNFIPENIVIVGGGVIGVEFASIWNSFGSNVTILEGSDTLLPNEDSEISNYLKNILIRKGIKVITNYNLSNIETFPNGLTVISNTGESLDTDYCLISIGRLPYTKNLNLNKINIQYNNDGSIVVNEKLKTNIDNVYAIGDIVRGPQLAHRGFKHGIFVAEEMFGMNPLPVKDCMIPKVVYSDPEISSIGLNEKEACVKYGSNSISSLKYNLSGNSKSCLLNINNGFVKLIRKNNGPIVGIHMIGKNISELSGEAQLIVNWEAFPEEVAELIHAHPTQNEALGEACLALSGRPLHTH